MQMPTQEEAIAKSKELWGIIVANFLILKDAGLFRLEHVKAYSVELVKPLSKELMNSEEIKKIVLVQTPELTVPARPTRRGMGRAAFALGAGAGARAGCARGRARGAHLGRSKPSPRARPTTCRRPPSP